MAASHPNAAISGTFGDASDAVMPTFVIPAASRRTRSQMNRSQLLADFVAEVGDREGRVRRKVGAKPLVAVRSGRSVGVDALH
jgi:hypothetical protein